MTSWNQIKKMPELYKHLNDHYQNHLPILIRDLFAQWIESHPWDNILDTQLEDYGQRFISLFIKEIQAKIQSNSIDCETRNLLNNYCTQLSRTYLSSPTPQIPYYFIKNIKEGIRLEKDLLEKINCRIVSNTRHIEIENMINNLKINCDGAENWLDKIRQFHDHLINESNVYLNKQKQDRKDLEKIFGEAVGFIIRDIQTLLKKIDDNFRMIDIFIDNSLDIELKKWLRCQQLAGNGGSMENSNLDQLQNWSEKLVDCILHDCRTINQANKLILASGILSDSNYNIDMTHNLNLLNQNYTCLLAKITQKTFVIEKQPPQVMKTNTRFTSTVRLLVGVKTSLHAYPPTVEVSIISEAQANNLAKMKGNLSDSMLKEGAGEIQNNRGQMEYNQISNHLSLNLRNMLLKKIRRTEKKGTESVMDEKFALLFVTRFKFSEQSYTAWTLSLPVVAVVHGNQEPHAWATITWDNAFADSNRLPFVIPDRVVWSKVGEVLSTKFKNSIFKGLNKDHLKFLAGKVFRNSNLSDYDQAALSWSLFSKEALPDQSFTFWEWFYALFKLTKDHLTKLWQDDLITFISRKHAGDLLIDRPPGTFILRFSDTELGSVTISYKDDEKVNAYRIVSIQPFTSKDLSIKCLADRVKEIEQCTHLYPDRPKDLVFKNYYTQSTVEIQSNGYVRPELVTRIPRLFNNNKNAHSMDAKQSHSILSCSSNSNQHTSRLSETPTIFLHSNLLSSGSNSSTNSTNELSNLTVSSNNIPFPLINPLHHNLPSNYDNQNLATTPETILISNSHLTNGDEQLDNYLMANGHHEHQLHNLHNRQLLNSNQHPSAQLIAHNSQINIHDIQIDNVNVQTTTDAATMQFAFNSHSKTYNIPTIPTNVYGLSTIIVTSSSSSSTSYSNEITNNKSNVNDFAMLEYSNGNSFANLPEFNKFSNSNSNSVSNSMDHCSDLSSFLPTINDEDLLINSSLYHQVQEPVSEVHGVKFTRGGSPLFDQ